MPCFAANLFLLSAATSVSVTSEMLYTSSVYLESTLSATDAVTEILTTDVGKLASLLRKMLFGLLTENGVSLLTPLVRPNRERDFHFKVLSADLH